MGGKMLPEVYFLKYAFPCARVLVDVRKTISKEEWENIKNAVENEKPLRREYLEKTFSKAFIGLKKISDNYWDVKVIRDYFWNKHEFEISNDLPPTIQRLCVVKKGKIVKKIGDYYRVDLGDGDVRIVDALYPAEEGDNAMIHYGYAVEKVD